MARYLARHHGLLYTNLKIGNSGVESRFEKKQKSDETRSRVLITLFTFPSFRPRCSRESSLEAFAVCRNFKANKEISDRLGASANFVYDFSPYNNGGGGESSSLIALSDGGDVTGANKRVAFVSCGSADYDADMTYSLNEDTYVYTPPVQVPISAPYLSAEKSNRGDAVVGAGDCERALSEC